MASADPQRQQHAQGKRRTSFILRGRPRGPGVPGGRTVGSAPAAGPNPRPRPEQSKRAGERAEPGSELEVSGGRPRLSRAAFSNSARWALCRQRGRGAFSLTLGGPGRRRRQWPQSWGLSSSGGPRSDMPCKPDLAPGSPHIQSLEPSQPNPLRVRKRLWNTHSVPGNFTWQN